MTDSSTDAARALLIDGFGRIRDGVPEVVDGLSSDELLWRPDPEANHIAWLLWHLTRQQDAQVAGLADGDAEWTHGDWAPRFELPYDADAHGYGMTGEQVGAFTIADASLFAAYQLAVYDRTAALVESLAGDHYGRVVDEQWNPPVTLGVRIISVLDDAAKHLGQAEYVKGLIERRR